MARETTLSIHESQDCNTILGVSRLDIHRTIRINRLGTRMAWQRVCTSHDLVEGQSVEVVFCGEVIAVYRHENALYALDGVCMHQGGPLARGRVVDGMVICPWHGWQYELATGNHAPTCKPMLKTYKIQESDGIIEIDLPI